MTKNQRINFSWVQFAPAHRVIFLLLLLAFAGCSYKFGPIARSELHTVHVPIFENKTFWRGLEFQLTEAVQKEIKERTRFRLAPAEQAETILTGEILDFRQRVLAKDAADVTFSKRVTVLVNFEWKDRHTGRVLMQGRHVSCPADLILPRGESIATATAEAFSDLAKLIVDRMEESW